MSTIFLKNVKEPGISVSCISCIGSDTFETIGAKYKSFICVLIIFLAFALREPFLAIRRVLSNEIDLDAYQPDCGQFKELYENICCKERRHEYLGALFLFGSFCIIAHMSMKYFKR